MQWHWGNIGSAVAGLSAFIIAMAAVVRSPGVVREIRARQAAQAEAAKAQAEAAREQAETIRLDRERGLSGWSAAGVETYGVTLVTETDELESAARELSGGGPTAYVVLRVSEGPGNVNRGKSLRQLIESEGLISRAPTTGELAALRKGIDSMGIGRAAYDGPAR